MELEYYINDENIKSKPKVEKEANEKGINSSLKDEEKVEINVNKKKLKSVDKFNICSDCGKEFATKKSLQIHKKNQICQKSEKPISCEICGKSFTHEGHLMVHARIHSVGSVDTTCELCGKFVSDLEKHKVRAF